MHGTTYFFGDYVFEAETRSLTSKGSKVKATSRQLDLLHALLRADGKIVSKTGLMNEVWKDVCVEEHTLLQTMFTLRRTLGKLASGEEYIETVPRLGYRIAAEAYCSISEKSLKKRPPQRVQISVAAGRLEEADRQGTIRAWWSRMSLALQAYTRMRVG